MRKTKIIFLGCCIFLGFINAVDAEEDGNEVAGGFQIYKSELFYKAIVKEAFSFKNYNKLMVFPLSADKMTISKSADLGVRRNWRKFKNNEFKKIENIALKVAERKFNKSEIFSIVSQAEPGTLALQVQLLEIYPRAFLDNGMDTIGKEYVRDIATVQFRIVVMDTITKEMVFMVEDAVHIQTRRREINNRSTHFRAWQIAYEKIMKALEEELVNLGQL